MELTEKQKTLLINISHIIDKLVNGFEHPQTTKLKMFELCDKNNADIGVVSNRRKLFCQCKKPKEWDIKDGRVGCLKCKKLLKQNSC